MAEGYEVEVRTQREKIRISSSRFLDLRIINGTRVWVSADSTANASSLSLQPLEWAEIWSARALSLPLLPPMHQPIQARAYSKATEL